MRSYALDIHPVAQHRTPIDKTKFGTEKKHGTAPPVTTSIFSKLNSFITFNFKI